MTLSLERKCLHCTTYDNTQYYALLFQDTTINPSDRSSAANDH